MGQRLALIIGNSLYADTTLARLRTPDVDVGAFGEILLDAEIGGFDDVNVLVNMSSHVIRRSIASFFTKRSRDDLLLLYFSGHGVLDDQGLLYLAVRDTDSKLLRGTAISASFITDEMNTSHSQRQVLMLDCCHSGAFARGTKGKTGSSVGTATAFEGSGYGRVVLTASDATQYAWEGDQVIGDAQNSLFTHYILEGIKNGAADANGDGQITIDELYDYVYEHVIRQTPRQTPGKWSYKEQGQIVIARVAPGAADSSRVANLRDVDPDLDERIDKLYNEGLSAYWLEEWDKAIRCFQTILEVRPDYPDAANKFELSKRQQRLLMLYNQALEAEEDGDWLLVVSRLDELLSLAPDYRDARQRLEVAKRNRLLSDLYAEARQLARAGKFRAVLNVFGRISDLQPDYPDLEGLFATAEEEVVKAQRQADLEQIHYQALREMDNGNWQKAEELFLKLQSEAPDYQGVNQLLERAQTELAKEEASRQRNKQVTMLSQQVIGLARAKQWPQVLSKIEEIKAIDPLYEDRDQLAATAQSEIERQMQETRREAQLAEMYATAVRWLETEDYQNALQQWSEVQAMDPRYPDRKKVHRTAKRKLKELADPKATQKRFSIWLIALTSLLGVISIIVLGSWWIRNKESGNLGGVAAMASKTPTPTPQISASKTPILSIKMTSIPTRTQTPRPSPTPTWKLTSTRIPTSTAATPLTLSDDFNQVAYNGSYNQNLWSINQQGPATGHIAQEDGMVSFWLDNKDSEIGLVLNDSNGYNFDSPIYAEANLMMDISSYNAQFGLEIGISQGLAICNITAESTDQICCFTFLPTNISSQTCQQVTPGTWHKVKIEISESQPTTIEFYIDDINIGQAILGSEWHITQNVLTNLQIVLITRSEKPGLGYLDDFSFGPVK